MRCPDRSADEAGRLRALAEYGLDDANGLASLDPIVDMAAHMFGCEASAVNMIGDDHVFFASSCGIGESDMSRDVSFCAHAINQGNALVIEDAMLDPRFHDNPLVTGGNIRFYAGIALRAPSGHALGALCVLDRNPRPNFSAQDQMRLEGLAQMVTDKLELRRLEMAAALDAEGFDARGAVSTRSVLRVDDRGRIVGCNLAATTMFDFSADEMTGQPIDSLVAEGDRPAVAAAIERARHDALPSIASVVALTCLRRGRQAFPAELRWSCWHEQGRTHFAAVIQDMTDRRSDEDALYRLANFDTLTELPNRNSLYRQIDERLARGERTAVVLIDIDGLTDINNMLGHAAGDHLLVAVSRAIRSALPAGAFLARVEGGDFAALIDDQDPLTIGGVARAISKAAAAPIRIDGHEVRVTGTCGMAIAPDHGDNAGELMASAALALFQARSIGRGENFLFIPNLRAEAVARRMYDAELHRAFERREFRLFYQPQQQLSTGAIVGAEALIRWLHPTRGLLAPAAFLPTLEAGALAAPVGRWVIDIACAQAARWRRFAPDFRISVNLTGALLRVGNLPEIVASALAKYRLPPAALDLEITENIILDGQEQMLAQLEEIRRSGVTLSFDDFGTGFASLNLLSSYPVTQIKIDKGFTQMMQTSAKERVIVSSLIDMAHQLGLGIVAEGVENQAAADFLRAQGCDKGQGFLFGAPVPAQIFEELYLARRTEGLARSG